MTKKFVTRALIVAGLMITGVSASFAQTAVASKVRRVGVGEERAQPVAASTVIMSSAISLSGEQRAKIAEMNKEAAALHAERTRLWSEYRAVKARPDFSDALAAREAAPRMLRIVEINEKLEAIAARQNAELATILTASQRTEVARLVANTKAAL